MQSEFSFTTRQTARTVGTTVEAIRTQYQRKGNWRGIVPTALPGRRLLWPRAEVLALAGKFEIDRRTIIDLTATIPWLASRALPTDDPMAEAIAVALNDPRDGHDDPQIHLDDLWALRGWVDAQVARLEAARHRMSKEQWADALRLLARAILPAYLVLPEGAMDQAVRDFFGGVVPTATGGKA